MNKVFLTGRLTKNPEIRVAETCKVAKYTLAVEKLVKRPNEHEADFIRCVSFGRNAEITEQYMKKGMKVAIFGRIQTGSYINAEGQKVYTTDIVVESQEFCEKRTDGQAGPVPSAADGYPNVPDEIMENMPFN